MNHAFDTYADAYAAGYSHRELGRFLRSFDASPGRSFGYRFELHRLGINREVVDEPIGRTVEVFLRHELDRLGRPGAYAVLYPPDVMAIANPWREKMERLQAAQGHRRLESADFQIRTSSAPSRRAQKFVAHAMGFGGSVESSLAALRAIGGAA
jgi:hypothetical protein